MGPSIAGRDGYDVWAPNATSVEVELDRDRHPMSRGDGGWWLHVGTFTEAGTLDTAVERLDHLVELGVDMVELLPLTTFPGCHGWGYDGVSLFSVHEPYGGPQALQRFVDAAHGKGLAVCLDVVYNHFGPSGNFLPEFGPYFTNRYATPWGAAFNLDGPGSDEVRQAVLDAVNQWLRDFHVDALRLDAVHEMHDDRALPLLEEMAALADSLALELGRHAWLVAESDRNDPGTVMSRATTPGGLGAWVCTPSGPTISTTRCMCCSPARTTRTTATSTPRKPCSRCSPGRSCTSAPGRGSAAARTGARSTGARSPGWRFVAALQTHDQVGNRKHGDRLSASVAAGAPAAGAALLLTSAYTPMLFMGEEWAASTPWLFFTDHPDPELGRSVLEGRRAELATHGWDRGVVPDPQDPATVEASRLDWTEPRREPHARMLAWYAALIALRRERADPRDPRLDLVTVRQDEQRRLVLTERGSHRVMVNLGQENAEVAMSAVEVAVPRGPAEPAYGQLSEAQVLLAWDPATRLDQETGLLHLPALSACVVGPATKA